MVSKGILNANDMGLGKTAETALFIHAVRQVQPEAAKRVLWLTKVQLMDSSARELQRWDIPAFPLAGNTSKEKAATYNTINSFGIPYVLVTNYETARTVEDIRKPNSWDIIVIDETHRLRSGGKPGAIAKSGNIADSTAKTWFAVKLLMEANPSVFPIFLTGTPVQNKPEDMFAYLHLFDPERFDNITDFQRVFGSKRPEGFFVDTNKLLPMIAGNFIRRTKAEVGIQMPGKSYVTHTLEFTAAHKSFREVLRQLTEDAMANLDTGKPLTINSIFAELHYLRLLNVSPGSLPYNYYPIDPYTHERATEPIRQVLNFDPGYPKLDYAFDLICELGDTGEQAVVFSAQYKVPLEYLSNLLTTVGITNGVINGDTKNASELEQGFQQGEIQVLLINLDSGAEGLNLHKTNDWPGGASHVIFLDRWYNPKKNEQGEDRCWRLGCTQPVTIHDLVLPGVDEVIAQICEDKNNMADGIMEDSAIRPTQDLITKLRGALG